MGNGAAVMSKAKPEYCRYRSGKFDVALTFRIKAAAALQGKSVQEYMSDALNADSARVVKEEPLKRLPPPPRPPRES